MKETSECLINTLQVAKYKRLARGFSSILHGFFKIQSYFVSDMYPIRIRVRFAPNASASVF
jgi:hypothetical protein